MPDVVIEHSDGKVNVEESGFFFFGHPKWGKTELSAGWPSAIHLVTSKKEVKKLKVDYIVVNSHERFKAAVDELCAKKNRKKYKKYKTIVVDVIDTIYTNCEEFEAKELGVKNIKDAGYGRGEARTDAEFRRCINKLIGSRYGVVFVSHWTQREIEYGKTVVKKNISTLPERARRIVLPLVNVIGYCDYQKVKVVDPETGKKKRIQQRVIRFEPTEEYEAGDRDGFLPPKIVIKHGKKQYHKTYAKIKAYYDGQVS